MISKLLQNKDRKLESKISKLENALEIVSKEIIQENSDIHTAKSILHRTSIDTQRLKDRINELVRIIPALDKKIEASQQIKFYEQKQSELENFEHNLNFKSEIAMRVIDRENFKSGKTPLHLKAKAIKASISKCRSNNEKSEIESIDHK